MRTGDHNLHASVLLLRYCKCAMQLRIVLITNMRTGALNMLCLQPALVYDITAAGIKDRLEALASVFQVGDACYKFLLM